MKCDYCDKAALANYQKTWVKYQVDEDGNYKKDTGFTEANAFDLEEPTGEDNLHLCGEHEAAFLDGDL